MKANAEEAHRIQQWENEIGAISAILLGYPGEGGREIAEKHAALWYGQPNKNIPREMIQADGQHFTKEAYGVLAKDISLLVKDIVDKLTK